MAGFDFKMTDYSYVVKMAAAEAITRALNAIGLEAEKNAKKACPVDTGRLRNSITHVVDDDAVYIGTNVEYAPYVEMGTSRTTAQPYIRPAIVGHIQEYKDIAMKELLK